MVVRTQSATYTLAKELADKLSAETLNDMMGLCVADEEGRRGPLVIMFDLRSDLGDEMENVPEIDSETPKGGTANYPTDWSWIKRKVGQAPERDVRISWVNEFSDNTSTGQAITLFERPSVVGGFEIEVILSTIGEKLKDKTLTGAEAKKLEVERGYWQGRKTTLHKNYRKAFKADQIIRAIEDNGKCNVVIEMEDVKDETGAVVGQTVTSSKVCMEIHDKTKPSDYWRGTLGSFLNINPDEAIANGGTVKDFAKTLNKGADNADVKATPPLKFSDLERTCVALSKLLDENNIAKLIGNRAKDKDTGAIYGHILYEAGLKLQAATIDLAPYFEQVERETKDAADKLRTERTNATKKVA